MRCKTVTASAARPYAAVVRTFLILLVAAVAGIVCSLIATTIADPTHRLRPNLVGLIAAALTFISIQAVLSNNSPEPPPSSSDNSDLRAALESSAASPSQASTPTPSASASSSPRMATSLLDLPAVELNTNSTIDLDHASGTVQINRATYGRALVYECSLFCNGSSPQVREVSLGRAFSRFRAAAAVLDTKTGEYRIDITLDSAPPVTFTTSPGTTTPIDLDVTGAARMRIEMFSPGPLKNPMQAGADAAAGVNGGGLPGVALGDPLLLP